MELWLKERIRSCNQLPSFPEAVITIINLSKRKGVPVDQVVSSMEIDPNLTRQVLSVANSAFYGFSREIDTLTDAVVLMGTRASLTISLSFLLMESIDNMIPADASIDYDLYWKRSLISAVAARELGDYVGCEELEQLFLAGLLQDIGILIFDMAVGMKYSKTIHKMQVDHLHLCTVEKKVFGADHAEVGAFMLNHWLLPESIVNAVRQSHFYSPEDCDSLFSRVVAASGHIADTWLCGEQDIKTMSTDAILYRLFDFKVDEIEPIFIKIMNKISEVAKLFNQNDLAEFTQKHKDELLQRAHELFVRHNQSLPHGLLQ